MVRAVEALSASPPFRLRTWIPGMERELEIAEHQISPHRPNLSTPPTPHKQSQKNEKSNELIITNLRAQRGEKSPEVVGPDPTPNEPKENRRGGAE